MSPSQRWLVVGALCFIAVLMSLYYVEYRSEPIYSDNNGTPIMTLGLILPLGTSPAPEPAPAPRKTTEPNPFDQFDPPNGGVRRWALIAFQRGIYARSGHMTTDAAIGGILLPLILLIAAWYLVLGGRATKPTNAN